jgi:hypothetical protein
MEKSIQLSRVEKVSAQPKQRATRIVSFESLFKMMATFNKEELERLIGQFKNDEYENIKDESVDDAWRGQKVSNVALEIGRESLSKLTIEILPVLGPKIDENNEKRYNYLTWKNKIGYADWDGGGGTDGLKIKLP